jgi:hypothetical protein
MHPSLHYTLMYNQGDNHPEHFEYDIQSFHQLSSCMYLLCLQNIVYLPRFHQMDQIQLLSYQLYMQV